MRKPARTHARLAATRGTVLVLVVGLLAILALTAVAFLVTSRYDKIGTQGFLIENQAEMLLGTPPELAQ